MKRKLLLWPLRFGSGIVLRAKVCRQLIVCTGLRKGKYRVMSADLCEGRIKLDMLDFIEDKPNTDFSPPPQHKIRVQVDYWHFSLKNRTIFPINFSNNSQEHLACEEAILSSMFVLRDQLSATVPVLQTNLADVEPNLTSWLTTQIQTRSASPLSAAPHCLW